MSVLEEILDGAWGEDAVIELVIDVLDIDDINRETA